MDDGAEKLYHNDVSHFGQGLDEEYQDQKTTNILNNNRKLINPRRFDFNNNQGYNNYDNNNNYNRYNNYERYDPEEQNLRILRPPPQLNGVLRLANRKPNYFSNYNNQIKNRVPPIDHREPNDYPRFVENEENVRYSNHRYDDDVPPENPGRFQQHLRPQITIYEDPAVLNNRQYTDNNR